MSAISAYSDRVITPPAVLALTLAEAKLHLRITGTAEDTEIGSYLAAAIAMVQSETHRQLVNAVREIHLDGFPPGSTPLRIPWAPLRSIDEVRYYDTAGDLQTQNSVAIAAAYQVDIYDEPGWFCPIVNTTWPTTLVRPRAVMVKYSCGYGANATDVDERARQAIRLLLNHLYENREATIEGTLNEIPLGAARLLEQLRYDDFQTYG